MNINENILKITGGANLSEPLISDHRARIETELECYSVEKRDNHDGTFNLVYKTKIVSDVQVTQGDKIIHGKIKNSPSKRLRDRICQYAREQGVVDVQEYYEGRIGRLIMDWERIDELMST